MPGLRCQKTFYYRSIQVLFDDGAAVYSAGTERGRTSLSRAADKGHDAVVKLLSSMIPSCLFLDLSSTKIASLISRLDQEARYTCDLVWLHASFKPTSIPLTYNNRRR